MSLHDRMTVLSTGSETPAGPDRSRTLEDVCDETDSLLDELEAVYRRRQDTSPGFRPEDLR